MKPLFVLLILTLTSAFSFAAHHGSQEKPHATEVCIVSGETLGSMGDPYLYIYKVEGQPDRELQFCCSSCEGRFESDPEKYLAKLDGTAAGSCCDDQQCCDGDACADCADGSCTKPCCEAGACDACATSNG